MNSGEIIKMMRRYRGLTQTELGAKMDLTQQRIGALEAEPDCYFSNIQKAAEACDFNLRAIPREKIKAVLPLSEN